MSRDVVHLHLTWWRMLFCWCPAPPRDASCIFKSRCDADASCIFKIPRDASCIFKSRCSRHVVSSCHVGRMLCTCIFIYASCMSHVTSGACCAGWRHARAYSYMHLACPHVINACMSYIHVMYAFHICMLHVIYACCMSVSRDVACSSFSLRCALLQCNRPSSLPTSPPLSSLPSPLSPYRNFENAVCPHV